jgi:hypothetical protein
MAAAPKTFAKSQSGFALVVALSLMAFVLMLLLSMSLLVQVETTNASRNLDQLRAKEAARLALMMALGDIQKHAGPDQRVTARAEILDSTADNNRLWTGVWNTKDPTASPKWLVSGETPDANVTTPNAIILQDGYDSDGDGAFTSNKDYPPTQVVMLEVTPEGDEIGWWVSDEGLKAPIQISEGIDDELSGLLDGDLYLGYEGESARVIPTIHDPIFDFKEIIDLTVADESELNTFKRIRSQGNVSSIIDSLDTDTRKRILAELDNSITVENAFVLSNPTDGGLKKDLSYLKNLDSSSTTQSDLDILYTDTDDFLTPAVIDLINFRGNPTAFPFDEIIGMQLSEPTVQETEDLFAHFTLAPVITEFQLSAGIAADSQGASLDTETDTSTYIVYKVYLELWNPYTIPFRIGDTSLISDLGFSDIRVVIQNLPSFEITNDDAPANTIQGVIDDVSVKWSDSPSAKTLRPGMVFSQTIPTDSFNSGKGAFVDPLTTTPATVAGTIRQSYTGNFTFSDPLEITIYAINADLVEREILTASIKYPNFVVNYDGTSSATRFKRDLSIKGGATGITKDSIELPGYAFGFRFKMLDEQESPGKFTDISNLLSKYDLRNRTIEVDLDDWDPDDAWDSDPPLPYDFDSSAMGFDPSDFDHSEGFQDDDFFHYQTANVGGRKDRIARFIDLPTSEIRDVGIFRSLKFKDFEVNSVGNSWGGNLNRLYDKYFFSTLPYLATTTWDGVKPLANSRIISHGNVPSLTSPETSSSLMLKNGFNLNSTSVVAWEKILSGKSFNAEDFELKFEENSNNFNESPIWKITEDNLRNVFFNHPQSAIFNLEECESDPQYKFVTRENTSNYIDAFSIDNTTWQNERQYPAFWQPIREFDGADITALANSIVNEIKAFGTVNARPLQSIEEFLNEGILEKGINGVTNINNRNGTTDLIPPYTPSHVSSMTLMNALGHTSFVRSDAFRIKALGRIKDPITSKTVAIAQCEAIIQRIPTPHTNPQFGREFKIIDISWTTAEQ